MKIYAISVFKKTGKVAVEMSAARELSSFGYFQRSSVNEFITLFCKTLAERTAPNVRQSVAEQGLFFCGFMQFGAVCCDVLLWDMWWKLRTSPFNLPRHFCAAPIARLRDARALPHRRLSRCRLYGQGVP